MRTVKVIIITLFGLLLIELPFNEPVVVEFTPDKSGEFALACGMGMLRGKVIVR